MTDIKILDLASISVDPKTGKGLELAKGYDAADALADGWTAEAFAARAKWRPIKPKAEAPSNRPKGNPYAGMSKNFEVVEPAPGIERPGMYFVQPKNRQQGGPDNGPHQTLERIWLCPPIRVTAYTRDHFGLEWGRLVELQDRDGETHQVVVPLALLAGSGESLRALLLRHGLEVTTSAEGRRRLMDLLLHWKPDSRARCVSKTGWHPGGIFVLPERTFGPADAEPVIFQSEADRPTIRSRGSVEDWRVHVSSLAVGNSRLIFALSVGFAASLLEFSGDEGGGFHFRGLSTAASSSGKTTTLRTVVSIGGPPELMRRWRITENGIEPLCEASNDLPLCLDELAQIDPKSAGDAAYLIAHGEGKVRSSRTGEARPPKRWRLLFLSSGEISLADHMAAADRKHRAGMEVRFIELPADAGKGLGVFEEIHGHANPADFARALTDNAAKYYGTALPTWVEWLIDNRAELAEKIKVWRAAFVADALTKFKNPSGPVRRVADRFALVAIAGELATQAGITGWPQGETMNAAKRLFHEWIADRGGVGNTEEATLVEQVRAFLVAHGESRFTDFHRANNGDDHMPRTLNRAGFVVRHRGGTSHTLVTSDDAERPVSRSEFYVFPEPFKAEVCAGYAAAEATTVLKRAGLLVPGTNRNTQKIRLPGFKDPQRVYVLTLEVRGSE